MEQNCDSLATKPAEFRAVCPTSSSDNDRTSTVRSQLVLYHWFLYYLVPSVLLGCVQLHRQQYTAHHRIFQLFLFMLERGAGVPSRSTLAPPCIT